MNRLPASSRGSPGAIYAPCLYGLVSACPVFGVHSEIKHASCVVIAGPADERRFLCDEMPVGLGRWLRIAGHDAAIAERGRNDRALVEQAHAEDRILLTRDRRLVEIRKANDRTIVLESEGIDAWAAELVHRLQLDRITIHSAGVPCATSFWRKRSRHGAGRCQPPFGHSKNR